MPSKSLLAYADVQEALDQALESERGIRVRCISPGPAVNLRHRMYAFRKLDRERNAGIYDASHPMHGRSAYDTLVIEACDSSGAPLRGRSKAMWKEGEAFVKVTKNATDKLEIEVL